MAELTGTGLLADDLYLLAHHEVSGRPFSRPRALGLGLAGGLLAELVLAGRVAVVPEVVVTGRAWPGDRLGRGVVRVLLSEPDPHPVREWLAFLAGSAVRGVAGRLARSGYLDREARRGPWRHGRWVPADPDCAFAPVIRVRAALDPARNAAAGDVVLAGLAVACGLGPRVLPYGPPGARRCLDAAVRELSPDLRELISQTQAAVDGAVLSHRG
jgi:hypothetical protein